MDIGIESNHMSASNAIYMLKKSQSVSPTDSGMISFDLDTTCHLTSFYFEHSLKQSLSTSY